MRVSTVVEIQTAIERLSPEEKAALALWLDSHEEHLLSAREEAALLAALDKAARELDAGQGVPIDEVRKRVAKWAAK